MPLNKEALIRYRVINRCLVNFRYASKERLIRGCEEALDISPIGERTIDQDIHDMKNDARLGYHAPIKFSREKNGYYYEDSDYSIDNIPINEEELEALSFTATMLEQYRNIGIFSTFAGAVQKIIDAINIRRILKEDSSYPFIEFDNSPLFKGSEFLEPIIHALKDKKVIRFHYQRFNSDRSHLHTVHPFLLKEYQNRWYLIGLNHDLNEIRTYGLDRIEDKPESTDIPFTDMTFNPEDHFKSIVGITSSESKPVEVLLKFTRNQGMYVLTKPIHESQEVIEESKDYITLRLKIKPTYEFISMILGWGAEVEVVSPGAVRNSIKKILEKGSLNYRQKGL